MSTSDATTIQPPKAEKKSYIAMLKEQLEQASLGKAPPTPQSTPQPTPAVPQQSLKTPPHQKSPESQASLPWRKSTDGNHVTFYLYFEEREGQPGDAWRDSLEWTTTYVFDKNHTFTYRHQKADREAYSNDVLLDVTEVSSGSWRIENGLVILRGQGISWRLFSHGQGSSEEDNPRTETTVSFETILLASMLPQDWN